VQVLSYGYDLEVLWETCLPMPGAQAASPVGLHPIHAQVLAEDGSTGSGVLRGTRFFDFDAGLEALAGASDVFWEQMTPTDRQMRPVNGASLCALGLVDYEALGFSDLKNLRYANGPLPGHVNGPNYLKSGSVFAVRTRTGRFVKVQVLNYGYDLRIRWQTCVRPVNHLAVKITIGSAPSWLVTRYGVSCTYNSPTGIKECGSAQYGPEGGILTGVVSNEGGAFPSSVLVTVTVDFQPETHLAGLLRQFTPPVTATGVNFLFEPYQVLQKTDLFFDLRPQPDETDFLIVRWKHIASGTPVAAGQKYLSGEELRRQPVTQYQIVFVPDPLAARDVKIEIEGRYKGFTLGTFSKTFELSDTAVIIRAQRVTPGDGYRLVSV
jgi:hypothetical protein